MHDIKQTYKKPTKTPTKNMFKIMKADTRIILQMTHDNDNLYYGKIKRYIIFK